MIALRVNGRAVELAEPTRLLDYVAALGVDPGAIAVEVNGEILRREDYAGWTLGEGDVVEIVRMVGGGSLQGGSGPPFQNPPSGTLGEPSAPPSGSAASVGDLGEDRLTRPGRALASRGVRHFP